jgi:superfamily II DNA or RNA helicase
LNDKFSLRYYQEDAVQSAIDNKICILELGTGAGKSLIAAEIIRRVNTKSLVVINRIELVRQTADMFEDYLGVKCNTIYDGEINMLSPDAITVVSVQSISAILKREDETTKQLKDILQNIGLIIFDECHGATDSGQYGVLAKAVINAHYIIGLTGTSFRADEHTMRMTALVGEVTYKKTTKELVEESFLVPTVCKFIKNDTKLNQVIEEDVDIDEEIYTQNKTYHDEYEMLITKSATRNGLIKDIVEKNKDKKILILTKLIAHGELLNEIIPNSKLITSKTNKDDRQEHFDMFKDSKYNVLVGSMQIFSTGINIPDLDLIINACGNKTDVGTIQSIGRCMRKSDNKSVAYYYDFYDLGSRYFTSASRQRMKILGDFGHNVEILQAVE